MTDFFSATASMANFHDRSTSSLGYDAVDDTKRRRQASPTIRSEDMELMQSQRQQLMAQSGDALRNFSILRWTLDKHLDFVAEHKFSCQTRSAFDTQLQDLVEEWTNEPAECDIARRHDFNRMTRMTEARASCFGDHLLLMLKSGQLQQVETDRLRNSIDGANDGTHIHGLTLDKYGATQSYKIWDREPWGGYVNPVDVPAAGALFHGYFPTYRSDQVRGVGLLSSGLNDFIDTYEWQGIQKQTAKLRSAMALVIYSDAAGQTGYPPPDDDDDEESEDGESSEPTENYEVEFGKGPFKLELSPGDKAEMLTDSSPSTQVVEFFKSTLSFALKSFDIPLCFYDEGLTNFFGQRAALILYLKSCQRKRKQLFVNVLRPATRWKITQWVAQGRLKLPANMTVGKIPFSWNPSGCPYWNPTQELDADIRSIGAGLGNWEDIYMERTGRDWFRDMERLREQQKHLEKIGLKLDPKTIDVIQILTNPNDVGSNPLSALPTGQAL